MSANSIPRKPCKRCHRVYPMTTVYFHAHPKTPNKVINYCKACVKGWTPEHFQYNILSMTLQLKGYKQCTKCLDVFPSTAEYFPPRINTPTGIKPHCLECTRKEGRNYQANIPLSKKRAYRSELKEKYPEKVKEYSRKWSAKNRERIMLSVIRYRARKKHLRNNFGIKDWRKCLKWFKYHCAYCGNGFTNRRKPTADHIIPLNNPICTGTIPTNIVPVCASCNSSKADRSLEQWLMMKFCVEHVIIVLSTIQDYLDSL